MVPAVGLIHAVRRVRDLIDQKLFRHNRRNSPSIFFVTRIDCLSARSWETLARFGAHSSRLNFVHYCFHIGQATYRLARSFANTLGLDTRASQGADEFMIREAAADMDERC
jgi:hypothetical protein